MTEQLVAEAEALLAKEALEVEEIERLRTLANTDEDSRARIRSSVDELEGLAQAAALFTLGRFGEAQTFFEETRRTKVGSFFLAHCAYELAHYELAAELFEKAYHVSNALDAALWLRARCLAMTGSAETRTALKALPKGACRKAERAFVEALYLENAGEIEEAVDAYRKIVEAHPDYMEAVFRLAFVLDRVGEDDEARALYEKCVEEGGPFANALLNMGVLCEDRGDFRQAMRCYKRVLTRDPENRRAVLYLRDARNSLNMYYDEEAERRQDKRNRVLEIPITDFELSVRSRNCLERINIRTLGDLTRVTEQELLSYKNFGETSLCEIKVILTQKNLRLGQALEEDVPKSSGAHLPPPVPQEILDKSIAELEMSVRARRCMERLGIETMEQLINLTERDLLDCKNFGQTSLAELRQKLAAYDLTLRAS